MARWWNTARASSPASAALSTCFNELAELLYEADVWAGFRGRQSCPAPARQSAIAEKIYCSSRWQEYRERLLRRQVAGLGPRALQWVRSIGLSVLSTGDYQFGVPARITANTFAGRGGIINIEREIQLSGSIHSKGVLTLAGYLGQRFAQSVRWLCRPA